MANKTVYPYCTEGRLPSSLGLINDLKTGGVDKALTAEQGKVIGEIILDSESFDSDNLSSLSSYDGKQFKADSSQVGKALSSVATVSQSGSKNYRIPVKGAYSVTYRKLSSSFNYGCLFLDASDKVVQGVVSTASDPLMRTVGVPDGAAFFIWSYVPSSVSDAAQRVCTVSYIKTDDLDSRLRDAESGIEGLEDELGKTVVRESAYSSMAHFKDGYQLKADSSQVGKSLDNVQAYANSGYVNVKIPVSGYSRSMIRQFVSDYNYGSLIVDENDVVLQGIVNDTGPSRDTYVDIPSNAAYLVYSYLASTSYSKEAILYKDGIFTRLESLEEKEDSSPRTVTGKSPVLSAGRINARGANVGGNYLTTETIFGDFSLILADGWKIDEGHIYDGNGNMVSYRHIHPDITHSSTLGKSFWSSGNTVPEYGLRLTVKKTDGSEISEGDNPFVAFVHFADSGLKRWIPNDLPNYGIALRRIDYLQHLRWIPLRKVPDGIPVSSGTDYMNENYCLAGELQVGVPYSDVAQTRKYVPNNVSLRTFMTAVKNSRSLLYTEELKNNVSKYGMSYQTGNRRAYYGSVCSGFTAWVMGLDTLYLSYAYADDDLPGLTTVDYVDENSVRPLDLLWWNGHVAIISDIYKDDFGKVHYIVVAEMSQPYTYRTFYTPSQFVQRMNGGEVHRWNGWENLTEPKDARELSQYIVGDVKRETEYNPDIMCFAGDYAAFAEGDIIHLNARRNSVYTGVELYKGEVLIRTIDITGLSADTIVTPNTEDWVDVDLTPLNLAYGKYKARLINGMDTTDYTYFEVIDINFSATKSGSAVTAYFSSIEGTPVSLERVKANGFADAYRPITAEMVEAGQATAFNVKTGGYSLLMLLVKGDYGTVCKTISIPT